MAKYQEVSMRAFDYISLALKDIRRQPVRTFLTVSALTISTVILVTLLAISLSIRQTIIQQLGLNNSLESIIVTPNQNVGLSILGGNVQLASDKTGKLDDTAVKNLGSIPHVASADPVVSVWEFKNFSIEGSDKQFVAQANGITTTNPDVVRLGAGTLFNGEATDHQVILGYAYAKELGYAHNPEQLVGKKVTITTVDGYRGDGATIPSIRSTRAQQDAFSKTPTTITATIAGVSTSDSRANQLLLPMGWTRQIKSVQDYGSNGTIQTTDQLGKNGYTTVALTADNVKNVNSITQAITKQGFGFISTQQQIDRITSLTTIMWGVLGAIAIVSLITAGLGIANTMFTTIAEQRYAIGVWRAVGARRRTIALRFMVQASLLGLFGGVLGAAAGYGISVYANHRIAGLLVAQNLPATDVIYVSPQLIVASIMITTLFGLLAGIYPAWRAAKQDPSIALTSQ
jgi:putative ABC transport system permease protein